MLYIPMLSTIMNTKYSLADGKTNTCSNKLYGKDEFYIVFALKHCPTNVRSFHANVVLDYYYYCSVYED